jgi:pseudaminic acid cytidylyltransferase
MSKKCVAIIPARGGSKRIPKKNIKDFFGKPLIEYSIKTALESNLFDKVIVSTDDEDISNIAKRCGADVPFVRPAYLSDDFTGTGDVVNHTLECLANHGEQYDYCCTIYPTAPFLQAKYLIQGLKSLHSSDAVNSFSVTSMPFPIQRTFKITDNKRCQMFMPEHFKTRSQDLEDAFQDAGQFYWEKLNQKSSEIMFGNDNIPIIIPRYLVQDIDTLEDWEKAEIMYEVIQRDIK